MGTEQASLLTAFYRAWSFPRIDKESVEEVLKSAFRVLWGGSYLELAADQADDGWVVLDLDAGMLRVVSAAAPGVLSVQGDLRQLPFSKQFDTIIVLGAVTAYLTADTALTQAACSLRTAIDPIPSARLLIDAYDRKTIHETDYFRGQGEWMHMGKRYRHTIRSEPLSRNDGTFLAELKILEARAPHAARYSYQFHQRAFCSDELQQAFFRAGWRLVAERSDRAQGRLFHTYELP